jgi:cytosine/adenosine deaminase-related metal-dependent hydrolase
MKAVGPDRSSSLGQPLKARWVFPVDRPPLERGTVELAGRRIADVHTRDNPAAVDLGNAAILPALVNAHTHLEFSDLLAPLEPDNFSGVGPKSFAGWIRSVVAVRRQRPSSIPPVRQGAAETIAAGTTLLADIVTDPAVPAAYPADGPGVVAFHEVIGLLSGQAGERLETARRFLDELDEWDASSAVLARGLSPHAPYSVGPELYHALVELAASRGVPVAVHLAETLAELELLRDGRGELVEMLDGFGVWSDRAIPRNSRPLDYLKPLAALDRALVIHGNYLDADEIAFIAANPQLTVVYCPRTHAFFGHRPHPWRDLLARGGGVAIGTDSRASNPDLSVFDELQFLRRSFPEVDPQLLLQLGTLAGAEALGFAAVSGSLTPGKSADLAIVALPESGPTDPFELLFHPGSRVVQTMRSGHWMAAT